MRTSSPSLPTPNPIPTHVESPISNSSAASNVHLALPTTPNKNPKSSPSKALEPNVQEVVLGDLLIKPWYPSFYPEELVGAGTERLWVCKWCFRYSVDAGSFVGHVAACRRRVGSGETGRECAPGSLIYERGGYGIWEVDGEEEKLYTQNISLFAKLFLDTKSVFYDVTTFLYYLLVYSDPDTRESQVIGFFSKEKMSWDNNNLACIIVFPPWQRQGAGQILMGVSYELSKREGRLGGPEKPLSELGRRAYLSFWLSTLARYILAHASKKTFTVREISEDTYIAPDDVITTLKEMELLEQRKKGGADVVLNKALVREWVQRQKVDLREPIDMDCFVGVVWGEEGEGSES
ncbi:hypothetical protein M501DRAFT_961629 [Patellaria atrata CBS 101060]|uniref:histone acetyltransferase n=1 Tax=Patellaria atrata CBS 101060 TaxID=1346257 RepID=A0A9P4S3J2_9PEZI|nr:hypothetical protein M501DRAFT_961629 [Patellaria atrata CBS 101060]